MTGSATLPATTDTALTVDFDPATPRPRDDGWTLDRQRWFIATLAETGSVRAACERAGMSTTTAYRLRSHPRAEGFRIAWDRALDASQARLVELAMERARDGTATPVMHKGAIVGERRVYSDQLLMFMLKRHDQSAIAREARSQRDPGALGIHDNLGRALTMLDDRYGHDENVLARLT